MDEKGAWLEQIEELCRAFSGQCGLAIRDTRSGGQAVHNPRKSFSAASLIKLPIMYHYGLLAQSGELDPQRRLPLQAEDMAPGFGVLQHLSPDCRLTINDLVTLMIILSDNTATNMVIDLLGIAPVNATLEMLRLQDTQLRRKMYDWQAQTRGLENMTTAQDVADLLLSLWQGEHLSPEMRERLLAILRQQQFRTKLPAQTAEPGRWAHKTGELDDADHDAGFLLLEDSAVIVTLLTSGGSGKQERVQLANQIGKLVYERFASQAQK